MRLMFEGAANRVRNVGKRFLREEVEPLLRSKKFVRRKLTFCKWVGTNCEVVGFLRGRLFMREREDFEIHLGIFNRRIFDFDATLNPVAKAPQSPELEECHWRKPHFYATPSSLPAILTIRSDVPFHDLGLQVRSALESNVLPLLDQAVTDEGLREFLLHEWRERGLWGKGGLTGFELVNLAVLLAELGPSDQLVRVVDACRKELAERPHATAAMRRLARIHELRPRWLD